MFTYYTSVLALCWTALIILCILVFENNRIPREDKRLLYMTYTLVAFSALAEYCGVWLDGRTEYPGWVLRVFKCLDYTLTPAAGGTLFMQVKIYNRLQRVMQGILAANMALQFVSVPFGWMVVVDQQNHYSHGPLFHAYLGICIIVIAMIIAQFILYGRKFRHQNQVSLCSIMLLVIAAIIIQETAKDARTVYLGMTLGAALMFIHYTEFSQLAADEKIAEQRIQLMLSQIKPHFLYNTLGSIEAMCERDPGNAKLATRKFSRYLRGNMDSLTAERVIPFDQELQHTRLYLELEQIRFGDALRVEYDIGVSGFFLPPLTLEPIVENAVKHGIRKNPDGQGTVSITSAELEDRFELRVRDDGPGFDPGGASDDRSHVGIRNVRERLHRICGGKLEIGPAPGRGTLVTICIPKKGEQNLGCKKEGSVPVGKDS